jgi:hypothetical protein
MLSRDGHYGKVEALRRAALDYKARYGSSYFDDLYRAHCAVGCGMEKDGVRVLSYLAPIKDKEVMLLGADLGPAFKDALYDVLACLRDRMNVTAFNLGVATPPLEKEKGWEDFPVVARMVDRGDPHTTASDIGAMELYASSVVSSDPLEVARYPGEVMPKKRFSGFFGTPLDRRLKELKPEKLIVVGVCTDICVMHTVADARNRDYPVEVPVDCVATFDEEMHRFALKHMEKTLGAELTKTR